MRATPLSLLLALALSPATLGSCISSPSQDTSAELRPEFKCADTVDNDDDGLLDCDDPACPRSCACDPSLCKERCEDNRDNDDDGLVDEGCPCRFNGSSNGVCLNGRLDGAGACSSPEGYQMVETACDGLDNDCDGGPDAGCNCRFDDKSSGVCLFAIVAPSGCVSAYNAKTIATQTVIVGLSAIGMTFVIRSGGIDLSVGSTIALSSVVTALCMRDGLGEFAAVVLGVASGAAVGFVNGGLVTRLALPPFIVTLGTLGAARGV